MKRRTTAAAVMAMAFAAGGAQAQSLEKSYADGCSTPASKTSETCQLLAKALVAKLQIESGAGAGHAQSAAASNPTPTAAELHARWGFLLEFIGKPTFAIDGPTATADTASRWVLEWQTPGEVLVRKKLGADGAELGSITYTWSKYTATVERNLAALGQIQTFSVEPNGNVVGSVLFNGTMGRERWEKLSATGYQVTTETNEGRGWVLMNGAMWQLATSDALAGAAQTASVMGQLYKNRMQVAEIKAKMQGGMTDAQFDQHIAELTARNQAYAEARRLKREARAKVIGGILVAAAGATAASVNGGDATQITGGALKGYAMANADDPASAQLGAQADAMIRGGSKAISPDVGRPITGGAQKGTAGTTHDTGPSVGPRAPLRFVLSIGLQPRAGDRVNPTCYSNVITRPGPAGWGQGGFLPPGSSQSAQAAVEGLKSSFIEACRAASGRNVTSEGDFHWTWNETRGGDAQIANTRARQPEDVTVSL